MLQMREITGHQTDERDTAVRVFATDDRLPGKAHHEYLVTYGATSAGEVPERDSQRLRFHKGPVTSAEPQFNGVTDESLIAIVMDRLQGFQQGQFKCRENAVALTHLEEAMLWLHHRTRARRRRGVEGQQVP